ncbi:MAG: phosphoenolpyruvate phosphomutase, partial [Centipeda sp. (in: firmicutes)]
YANQLTRAAFPAMESAARSLLVHHRAHEIDSALLPIKDIIRLIEVV